MNLMEHRLLSFQSLQNVFYCPNCSHISEYREIEPLICPKCKKPAENRVFVRVRDLSGNLIGKRLILKGMIVGEGVDKTIPVDIIARCDICGVTYELNLKKPEYKELLEKLFFIKKEKVESEIEGALPRGPCKVDKGHKWLFDYRGWLDFREVKIQDLIEFEEAQEREAETRSGVGILLEKTNVKNGLLDCEVMVAPDNRIMLLVYRVTPLELTEGDLKKEDFDKIKAVFQGKNLKELEMLCDRIIAPEIRGRSKAKLAAALTALSPTWFRSGEFKEIPGCLRTLFFGDPRTGKGMILRWFYQMGIAGHAVGETASRTGLVYAIDPELKILSWGVLPLNDGRMVSIEGMHGLSSEEMKRFREVLIQQRAEVTRFIKGSAWCRTRILADVNPNQPSLSSNYPYICVALLDCKPFYDPIDLTRWDLFIPFRREDVAVEEMYGKPPRPTEDEVWAFISLVKWLWSRRIGDIKITEEAFKEAKKQFKELYDEYACETIPVIHNGTLWTILRLSIALAALKFNTSNNAKLIVESQHVIEAVNFLKWSLDQLEIGEARIAFEEPPLTASEIENIKVAFNEDNELRSLFFEIVRKPGDLSELAGRLEVSEATVKRKASKLKELGLVQRAKIGYRITKRGTQFFRLQKAELSEPTSEEGKKDFAKKFSEVKNQAQKAQRAQLSFLSHVACEKCGKMGSYLIVRESGIHYLCEKCLRDWEGSL